MGFKNIVLSVLLLTSTSVLADSIGWGTQPSRPGVPDRPGRPEFPERPSQPSTPSLPSRPTEPGGFDPWGHGSDRREETREVEEYVGQYFNGQSRLDLLADYYVLTQLRGLRIKDITIVASTEMGHGTASLVLNGQSIESSKVVARQMSSYTFRVDSFANQVGLSLRTIELSMQGRFYVEKVVFNLFEAGGPHGPGPGYPPPRHEVEVLKQSLYERIEQEGGIDLFRMFRLGFEKQGQEVKRIIVMARSARGMGMAHLMVNNQQASSSQSIGIGLTRLTFEIAEGMNIGQEIQALKLIFRGNITVEEVSLELEKESRGGGRDRYPREPHRR